MKDILAKTFNAQKLDAVANWGLTRDGTTKRKQKILDTSVTLATRDVISLGFSRVSHETALTINDITIQHVSELADVHRQLVSDQDTGTPTSNDEYLRNSLSKLAFTMNDQASNEKLADKLLEEWRDSVLLSCEDEEEKKVHHFHCMASVRLS